MCIPNHRPTKPTKPIKSMLLHIIKQALRASSNCARQRQAFETWSASAHLLRHRAHRRLTVVRCLSSRTARARQRYTVFCWKAQVHFVSFQEHLQHFAGCSLSSRRRQAAMRRGWTCWGRVLLRARKRDRALQSGSARSCRRCKCVDSKRACTFDPARACIRARTRIRARTHTTWRTFGPFFFRHTRTTSNAFTHTRTRAHASFEHDDDAQRAIDTGGILQGSGMEGMAS